MSNCVARKADGTKCSGKAKDGEKWCSYHKKKYSNGVTHGLNASPELLGIPKNEHLTFETFHAQNKPFELTTELAYLRTLLVESRKAMEASRASSREEFFKDLWERSEVHLQEAGMKDALIEKLLGSLHPIWVAILEAYYGAAEPLQPEQFQLLADMIEKVSRVAEKAKKIQDGITLNVEFKNVGPILVRFVREVLFCEITDPEVRQRVVERVRALNLLGQTTMKQLPASEDVYDNV